MVTFVCWCIFLVIILPVLFWLGCVLVQGLYWFFTETLVGGVLWVAILIGGIFLLIDL